MGETVAWPRCTKSASQQRHVNRSSAKGAHLGHLQKVHVRRIPKNRRGETITRTKKPDSITQIQMLSKSKVGASSKEISRTEVRKSSRMEWNAIKLNCNHCVF